MPAWASLRVAVNLSARQFGAADLVPGIEQVLADTGPGRRPAWNWS